MSWECIETESPLTEVTFSVHNLQAHPNEETFVVNGAEADTNRSSGLCDTEVSIRIGDLLNSVDAGHTSQVIRARHRKADTRHAKLTDTITEDVSVDGFVGSYRSLRSPLG
jgi:hypothetical protein